MNTQDPAQAADLSPAAERVQPDGSLSGEVQRGGFEPRGLPGYRVFRDVAGWIGCPANCWYFTVPADVPQGFDWDDATQDHTTPVYRSWAMGPRMTAKGAVAAAFAHAEWVAAKLARAA